MNDDPLDIGFHQHLSQNDVDPSAAESARREALDVGCLNIEDFSREAKLPQKAAVARRVRMVTSATGPSASSMSIETSSIENDFGALLDIDPFRATSFPAPP